MSSPTSVDSKQNVVQHKVNNTLKYELIKPGSLYLSRCAALRWRWRCCGVSGSQDADWEVCAGKGKEEEGAERWGGAEGGLGLLWQQIQRTAPLRRRKKNLNDVWTSGSRSSHSSWVLYWCGESARGGPSLSGAEGNHGPFPCLYL